MFPIGNHTLCLFVVIQSQFHTLSYCSCAFLGFNEGRELVCQLAGGLERNRGDVRKLWRRKAPPCPDCSADRRDAVCLSMRVILPQEVLRQPEGRLRLSRRLLLVLDPLRRPYSAVCFFFFRKIIFFDPPPQ